ncbi:hypothetical protein ACIRD3_10280 [Kitasatospora sp. NPDC093550]|uniref:hypothetical protein n=1 Tax=Kitasatospora sp. NPDC093550 TaxID=3364089 RepID=UPI0037FB382C
MSALDSITTNTAGAVRTGRAHARETARAGIAGLRGAAGAIGARLEHALHSPAADHATHATLDTVRRAARRSRNAVGTAGARPAAGGRRLASVGAVALTAGVLGLIVSRRRRG